MMKKEERGSFWGEERKWLTRKKKEWRREIWAMEGGAFLYGASQAVLLPVALICRDGTSAGLALAGLAASVRLIMISGEFRENLKNKISFEME